MEATPAVECRLARRRWRVSNRAKYNAARRRWYAANLEKVLAASRRWYVANSAKSIAKARCWEAANPEKVLAGVHRRRLRVQGNGGPPLTTGVIRSVMEDAAGFCAYCMSAAKLTVEHFMPVSKGGTNDRANLAAVCKPCNSSKGDKTPLECGTWVPPSILRASLVELF